MKQRTLHISLVGLSLFATMSLAERFSYVPKAGFVPDKQTAIRVAEAILLPIYGEKRIANERPFSATLNDNTWRVEGYIAEGSDGGVAEVEISKSDGRILHVSHGK
jgi:hypothetical protein